MRSVANIFEDDFFIEEEHLSSFKLERLEKKSFFISLFSTSQEKNKYILRTSISYSLPFTIDFDLCIF